MKSADVKKLVRKAGLTISQQVSVSFTRAAKRTTQGIEFAWEMTAHDHLDQPDERYSANRTIETLTVKAVAREGVLTDATKGAEAQAKQDQARLVEVLKAAGIETKPGKYGVLMLPAFTRQVDEYWGKRLHKTDAGFNPKRDKYHPKKTIRTEMEA